MKEFVSNLKSIFNENILSELFGFLPSEVVTFLVVCLIFLLGLAIKRIFF